jgi:hypothetical protein
MAWWLEARFSEARAAHWRWTLAAVAIGGERTDFIGRPDATPMCSRR